MSHLDRRSFLASGTAAAATWPLSFDGLAAQALAKKGNIALHLDGARLFLQSAYTGTAVAEYARPFDTVYMSPYKYFNAPFGAILAGPRQLLDQMHHTRRMFGSGLAQDGRPPSSHFIS